MCIRDRDTLGASLIKKAVCLVVVTLIPGSVYEKIYPLSSSKLPSVTNAEPQCDMRGVIVLLIKITPVLAE